MESFSGDTGESTEDIPGRKKSKLKSLKTRLFGRSKRAGVERSAKLSQSESDITAGKGLGSEEDLACSEGMMGSRALSHDSIFLADEILTEAEPVRVLSQENVHSKVKFLQMKLQQQKMHLGPPPLVLPIRRPEDLRSRYEDEGFPHSPLEILGGDVTTQGALSKTTFQPPSRPLSPIPKPTLTKSVPLTSSLPLPLSVPSNTSVVEPPLDFSSPAQFNPLDTSAARHRMSIKPRNQRASTKKKPAANDSRSHLHTLNNVNNPESVREEEQWLSTQVEVTLETEQGGVIIPIPSQLLPSKSPDVATITQEATSKSSSLTFSQQDQALPGRVPSVTSQVLRVKPHRPADVMSSERPRSSFTPSELKDKREGDFEIQVMSHDKRNTLNKAGMTEVSSNQLSSAFGSVVAFRSPSVHQQVQSETENIRGIKRAAPGSGSFHFSITTAKSREGERPRSGSFVGVLEHTEARHRTEEKPLSNMRGKEELRDLQPRGGTFAVGRLRQEGALNKSPVLPWDRRDSLKKVEAVAPSKNITADTLEGEEVESRQEVVEEAMEAQEAEEGEESKTAFGIKLRSTSQSVRFRSDASSNHNSKPPVCEGPSDKQKRQEISDNASYMSKILSNISCTPSTSADVQLTDPTPCGLSLPVKNNPPSTGDPHIMPTEVQTNSSKPKEVETSLAAPQEPKSDPQTSSSEVSWMSLAMEKTRSLQQLFTSRFPRDFTGGQTAARPQAQTTNQTDATTGEQTQTQTVKVQQSATPLEAANQPSTDAAKAETVPSRSQAQTFKPSLMGVQQKMSMASPVQSNTSREAQTSKESNEPQSIPNTAQSTSVQTNARTIQSPMHSYPQTEISSQFAQGSVTQSLAQSYLSSGQQQPPWSNRGLHPTNQLKSTTSVSSPSSATAPPPVSALGRGEREAIMQEKEGASLSGRRAVWAGSISEKAAFLEKRAEWTAPPGTKGVELKKAQTEAHTSGESPASAKTTPLSKDTKPEGRQGVKPAESSPYKVPDRPREDKWLRKNVTSSSSPSSSPTMPSPLQSMSDSSQPSWMELAKRKSMAWSDKSMD
ncbi:CRACD-like protein isoform X1 [Micropterus salmoides]|uniref:CRACD-like protein isoform X1 n=2 Tax=Micropterus salmoides TaxID=27706 RepID=UPI0018EA8255|nr:CRACD-like protein isoform X1 [Micropterus salmoides]XP_038576776.1 CRACD-like protein isoform X1 [Micropterus salmoides]